MPCKSNPLHKHNEHEIAIFSFHRNIVHSNLTITHTYPPTKCHGDVFQWQQNDQNSLVQMSNL
jgi:hypothetical protein